MAKFTVPKVDGLNKRLIESVSATVTQLEKSQVDTFIENVDWILCGPPHWRGSEEFQVYERCFYPEKFWPLFEKALSILCEHNVDSPRQFWILQRQLTPEILAELQIGKLKGPQARFVYLQLLSFFASFNSNDSEFRWWYEKGRVLPRTLEMLMDPSWIPYTHFEEVKRKLELLSTNTERLKLAITEKTRAEQNRLEFLYVGDGHSAEYISTVLMQLQLEIESLREIIELDSRLSSDESNEKVVKESEVEIPVGKPKLTVDQFIMLMFAIGGERLFALVREEVATGLSSLTGNSVTEFIKRFSWVLPTDKEGIKKFNNQTDTYNKDVIKVCGILEKMGMNEEANKLKENSNF